MATAAMIKHILFPFDFSTQGVQTAPFVRAFAGQLGANVTIVSVVPLNRAVMPIGMDDDVAAWTRALQARLDQALTTEFGGVPVKRITEHAREEDADLILIGRGSLQAPLGRLRTHAYGIIQRSPCLVLSL